MQDMPNAEEPVTSNEPDDQVEKATSADLEEYFSLPNFELLSKLGTKYEIVATDDEIRILGSYYSKLDERGLL